MTTTQDEYLLQKNYDGIWMKFGDIYQNLQTVKIMIEGMKGEFRIFKRTVTNWEEVKQ